MALRTKTIEYAFPYSTTSVAAATARDFTSITVYIPEASPTFRSVILETSYLDAVTSATSMTTVVIGVALGAVARNDVSVGQTVPNSGENQSFLLSRDATSYFTTNWTGTSMTAACRITVSGISTINATAKLIITYEYDDTAVTTRIKTVRIPMEGNNGNLTTTLANLGGVADQIPALDTWLPEASKVYRDIFVETWGHSGSDSSTTTDGTLTLSFDSGSTTVASGIFENALLSDRWFKRIDKLNVVTYDTSITQSIQARTNSTAASPFPCLCSVMVVTYEYDHSTTTQVMNSIIIPAIDEAGFIGSTTSADGSRFYRRISIQEPGTLTLVHSAIQTTCNDGAAVTLNLRVGSQDYRTFTHPTAQRSGGLTSQLRFDADGISGAGITIARGFNEINIDYYTTSNSIGNIGSNMSGIIYLNYTSDLSAGGDGAHAHSTVWINRPYTVGLNPKTQYAPATTPIIPETSYWIMSIGYELKLLTAGGATTSALGFSFQGEVQSTEVPGAGWADFYSAIYTSDNEVGTNLAWARARDDFKRYPEDVDAARFDVETLRDYRFDVNVSSALNFQVHKIVSYHSHVYAISGTISGSSGGVVTLQALRTDTHELITEITRTGNGSYTINWYDNTNDVIVLAYESDLLKGASIAGIAGTDTFDINLLSGGPTYYSYA